MKKSIILSLIFFLSTAQSYSAPNRDMETVRARVVATMMAQRVDDARVKELIATLRSDGTWPGIDYQDVRREAFAHTRHLTNMTLMCRAYKKKESSLRGKKELKNAINLSLNYWLTNDFICENWWNNEIGTPDALTTILLVMDKDLSKEQIEKASVITGRAHIDAWGARQSGDRIKITGIQAKNMLFKRDTEKFEMLLKVIEGEMRFVPPNQRGLKSDFSFHHRDDFVNNTLSYGSGYASAFVEWTTYLAGTSYQFSKQAIELLVDYYLDGMCKQMVYGKYPDPGIANRDITRRASDRPEGAGFTDQLMAATNYRHDELQEISNIRNGLANTTLSYGKFFWMTEYYSHQRPHYFTSVRMFSSRNANMEEPYNGEGLTNHHRGDGTNYISLTGLEYLNMTPVNDWQKIAGTTVMQKPAMPPENEIQKYGVMDFVGAVTDGLYGAVGFDFISPHDPLRARKAWFFFDDEYVCLGAGIRSQSNLPVVTAVDQRLKGGDVEISSHQIAVPVRPAEGLGPSPVAYNGSIGIPPEMPRQANEPRTVESVKWVYHDGIGYLFPDQPVRVRVEDKPVTGNWTTSNRQVSTPKEDVTMNVFKLWIEHGSRLNGATYQYIVMPGVSKEKVAAAWDKPAVTILSNTPDMQAVWHNTLNILQMVCYKNGQIKAPGGFQITMNTPGIAMVKIVNGRLELSVSDPSRNLAKMHLTIDRKVESTDPNFHITWNEAKKISEILVDMPTERDHAGESLTAKF